MNLKNILCFTVLLSIAACGGDDSPSIEELEAAQSGDALVKPDDFKGLDRVPITKELAKDICIFELAGSLSAQKDNPTVINACECATSKLDLAALTEEAKKKRKAQVPFESRGIVITAIENAGLVPECFPFM